MNSKIDEKAKICTKCGIKYFATLKFFPSKKKGQSKDGLCSWCRICHNNAIRIYRQSGKGKRNQQEYKRQYNKTFNGHFQYLYDSMKQRCNNPNCPIYQYYGGRGIKNLFTSSDEFKDYMINELQIDPSGLQMHRIDNDRHYEKGNIKFLTPKEHRQKHR